MEYSTSIVFTCWEKDPPLEIQLEPEAIIYTVLPGEEITFKGDCDENFEWSVRVDQNRCVQLFPDSKSHYKISIFKNGLLLL